MNNKKRKNFLGQVINTLISIIFIIVFATVISLMIQKFALKKEVPDLFGYKILQVMSGSMSGEFETGDTILIKKISDESNLKIGDVVTYKVKTNTLVTHRIVNITKTGESLSYTMKGDANNTEDAEKITFSVIEGIYVKKLGIIGNLINLMQRPYGMVVIFTIPIVMIICVVNSEKVKEEKRNKRREKRLNYELKKSKEQVENKKKEEN